MKVLLDTNIFRNIAEGDFDEIYERFVRLPDNGVEYYSCPIALIEIGRHMRLQKGELFGRYQSALKVMRDLCEDRMLPLPSPLLRTRLFPEEPTVAFDPPEFFVSLRDYLIGAGTVSDLAEPQIIDIHGEPHELIFDTEAIEGIAARIEAEWVSDAESASLSVLGSHSSSDLSKQSGRLVIKSNADKKKIKAQLRSVEQRYTIAQGLLGRATQTEQEIEEMFDVQRYEKALSDYEVFIQTYLELMLQRLINKDGYNFSKHDNDRLDLEYLLYLPEGFVLCSGDNLFIKRVHTACPGSMEQVLSPFDLISRVQ
jgi:hypothetical protein